MKNTIYLMTGMLFLAALLAPLHADAADQDTVHVVCTNTILADFTSHLLNGTGATVDHIMPAGSCPSHFDTRPSDVQRISSADIVISLGWEPWLQDLLDASGATATRINCAGLGEWNLPTGALTYVQALRDNLTDALPARQQAIRDNAESYLHSINQTAEDAQRMITSKGYTGKKVVCMEWQQAYVSWLGLNVTATYAPPERLSTGDMLNVTAAASGSGVCAVVDNLQSGTSFGASMAADAQVSHVVLTNFPGAAPTAGTYLDMLTYNTEQLVSGITAHQYKQGEINDLEGHISVLKLQRNVTVTLAVISAGVTLALFILYRRK
ncbi:MAG: metal ABC transporter substrate-binding protein [Thermoplasmatota archaeon]